MQKQPPTIGRLLVMVGFALSCFGLLLFLWLSFGGSVPFKPKGYRVTASFAEASILAGDPARFTVRVRDAANQPVVGLPIRYWTGPRGTEPPKDDALWERRSTFVRTDAAGQVVDS